MITRRGFLKGCIIAGMAPAVIKLEVLMPPVKEIILVPEFDPILIKMVRRAMPNIIAYDLVGVQPMTEESGEIFKIKHYYEPTVETRIKQFLTTRYLT